MIWSIVVAVLAVIGGLTVVGFSVLFAVCVVEERRAAGRPVPASVDDDGDGDGLVIEVPRWTR